MMVKRQGDLRPGQRATRRRHVSIRYDAMGEAQPRAGNCPSGTRTCVFSVASAPLSARTRSSASKPTTGDDGRRAGGVQAHRRPSDLQLGRTAIHAFRSRRKTAPAAVSAWTACPAKNKAARPSKAINMEPQPILEQERENWDFFASPAGHRPHQVQHQASQQQGPSSRYSSSAARARAAARHRISNWQPAIRGRG